MITLTELAASKVQSHLQKRGKGVGIRLGVKTTGCSGLAYTIEYVDSVTSDDHRFESNSCSIFVDQKSLAYMDGMTIDWRRQGLNEGFNFVNPLELSRCGCGESFSVKTNLEVTL